MSLYLNYNNQFFIGNCLLNVKERNKIQVHTKHEFANQTYRRFGMDWSWRTNAKKAFQILFKLGRIINPCMILIRVIETVRECHENMRKYLVIIMPCKYYFVCTHEIQSYSNKIGFSVPIHGWQNTCFIHIKPTSESSFL